MALDKKAQAAAAAAYRKELEQRGLALEEVNRQMKEYEARLKQVNEVQQNFLDFLLNQQEAHRENLILMEEANKAQARMAEISKEIGGATLDTANYARTLYEGQTASLEVLNGYTSTLKRVQDDLLKKRLMLGKITDENREQVNQLDEAIKKNEADLAYLQEKLDAYEKLNKALEKQTKALNEIKEGTEGFVQSLTGVTKDSFESSMLGKISNSTSLADALNQVGESMTQVFTVGNILGAGFTSVINETIMMTKATDEARAGFFKATGASAEYSSMITEVREESAIMGVNVDEAAAAIQDLYTNMRGFTDLTKEGQAEVANFTAQMGELGVNTGLTADLLDSATKSLNMTSKEGMSMVKEVSAAAKALNIPVAQMNEDLKAALPTLAAYGAKGVQVFKGIAAQAKAAGLATGDLLGIVEQFDTFESAAESVGRLNGILGGNYLNSLEMVHMTEDERVRTLIQTLEMTGRNWESLGKYERKAIAASIGIQDMDKANRLLGMSTAELDEKMSQADAGILSKEEMQEMADRARSFAEKLENLMQSMAVFLDPIISVINAVLEGFLKLDSLLGGNLAPVVMTLGGAYAFLALQQNASAKAAAVDAVTRLQNVSTMGVEAMATQTSTASKISETVVDKISFSQKLKNNAVTQASVAAKWREIGATIAQTAAMIKNGIVMAAQNVVLYTYSAAVFVLTSAKLALAAAAGAAGISVGALVGILLLLGVALLVALHSPPLYIGLGILVGLMIALAFAGGGAVAPMIAFGAAMLKVGFAVAMASVGFIAAGIGAMFFGVGLVLMAAALVVAAVGLVIVVAAILALAAGLAIIGMFAFLAAPGLIFFAGAILTIIPALMLFALLSFFILPPLFMLAVIVAIIGTSMALMFNAMADGAGVMGTISSGLAGIEEAMSNLSLFSVFKFLLLAEGFEEIAAVGSAGAASLNATADVIRATSTADVGKVDAVEELVSELGDLAITATIFPGLIFASAFMDNLTSAMGGGDTGAGDGKGHDIYLVMDPSGVKTIAKAVDVHLNKKHNILTNRS